MTVKGSQQGTVNINTASHEVLRALNVGEAMFTSIEQTRRQAPYTTNPGVQGAAFSSRTFRIEAQGLIDGHVRARLTAVVQKRQDNTGVVVLEWSGIR